MIMEYDDISRFIGSQLQIGEELRCGFRWGPASVTRVMDEPGRFILMSVETPKARADIYVTRTGEIRLFINNEEVARSHRRKRKNT